MFNLRLSPQLPVDILEQMRTFVRELIESFTRPHLAEDEDVFYCQIERLMDFLARCANNVMFEEFDVVYGKPCTSSPFNGSQGRLIDYWI